MSRLSHKLFSFGWTFKLRHLASKFCLLSDALSRIFDQEMLITRVPLNQKVNQDCDEFFKTYKDSLPKHWISGEAEISQDDLFNNLTYQICRDPRISENLRLKRFRSLLQRVHETFKPQVQRFIDESEAKIKENEKVKTMSMEDGTQVKIAEPTGEISCMDIKCSLLVLCKLLI